MSPKVAYAYGIVSGWQHCGMIINACGESLFIVAFRLSLCGPVVEPPYAYFTSRNTGII